MKNRKRNLTVLAVMMFVCAAVALNWSYNSRWGKPDAEMVYAEDEAMAAAQMDFEKTLITSGTEYFAEARLTRQVSRDEALELLQTAAASDSASQETIDGAMSAIANMAAWSLQETQIENLLLAKNFEDCVLESSRFLDAVIAEKVERGKPIPEPTPAMEFRAKLDPADGEPICIVPVPVYLPAKTERINITGKSDVFARINDFARRHHLTRSELMIRATLEHIRANS